MAGVEGTLLHFLDVLCYRGVGLVPKGAILVSSEMWLVIPNLVEYFTDINFYCITSCQLPQGIRSLGRVASFSQSESPLGFGGLSTFPHWATQTFLGLWYALHSLWEDWGTLLGTSSNASFVISTLQLFGLLTEKQSINLSFNQFQLSMGILKYLFCLFGCGTGMAVWLLQIRHLISLTASSLRPVPAFYDKIIYSSSFLLGISLLSNHLLSLHSIF